MLRGVDRRTVTLEPTGRRADGSDVLSSVDSETMQTRPAGSMR